MGSGSSVIAALELHHEILACEIDEEYYATAVDRIGRHEQQGTLAMTRNAELSDSRPL
jgi:DNA modification methylase